MSHASTSAVRFRFTPNSPLGPVHTARERAQPAWAVRFIKVEHHSSQKKILEKTAAYFGRERIENAKAGVKVSAFARHGVPLHKEQVVQVIEGGDDTRASNRPVQGPPQIDFLSRKRFAQLGKFDPEFF
jgi:hypothetical protein